MRCLYCDRPLALLKRLTGDGEFCSKEHRKIYQQEHNHLALARLLESQPKVKEKARPDKAVKPEPETADFIKAAEVSQPKLAGFCPRAWMRVIRRPRRGSPTCRVLIWGSLFGVRLKRTRFFGRDRGPKPQASWRVRQGLALSRALPDYKASSIPSQRPEIYCWKRKDCQRPPDGRGREAPDLFSNDTSLGCLPGPRGRQGELDVVRSRRLQQGEQQEPGVCVIPNSEWRSGFPASRRSEQRPGRFAGRLSRHAGNPCLQYSLRKHLSKLFWFLDRFCSGPFDPPTRMCRRTFSKYSFSRFPIRPIHRGWGAWKNACTARIASDFPPLSSLRSGSRTEPSACLNSN